MNEAYRSPRVNAVIDIFHQHRDRGRSGNVFLVVNENVISLDILEIATNDMGIPVLIYQYDERLDSLQWDDILSDFIKCDVYPRAMLITRATGGQGLNIQAANIIPSTPA